MSEWSSGEIYESYVGRWSRLVAAEFVAWLDQPTGLRWLDVGCGTGALTSAILRTADPASVLGVDPSAGFVEYARKTVTDERASFEVRSGDPFGRVTPLQAPGDLSDLVVGAGIVTFDGSTGSAYRGRQYGRT